MIHTGRARLVVSACRACLVVFGVQLAASGGRAPELALAGPSPHRALWRRAARSYRRERGAYNAWDTHRLPAGSTRGTRVAYLRRTARRGLRHATCISHQACTSLTQSRRSMSISSRLRWIGCSSTAAASRSTVCTRSRARRSAPSSCDRAGPCGRVGSRRRAVTTSMRRRSSSAASSAARSSCSLPCWPSASHASPHRPPASDHSTYLARAIETW